jgi:hypothetical protein
MSASPIPEQHGLPLSTASLFTSFYGAFLTSNQYGCILMSSMADTVDLHQYMLNVSVEKRIPHALDILKQLLYGKYFIFRLTFTH